MQVVAHPDPFVLEEELLDGIGEAQRDDPLAPVLVLVPTRRLARHVSRRIALRHGARLAVDVLHHRALAFRILDAAGSRVPRLASRPVLGALLDRVLRDLPAGPLGRFLTERPRARRALHDALIDLREAGISPGAATAALRSGERERALAAIYAAYVRAVENAADGGLVDEAGLVAAARPAAPAFAARYRAAFHHGTYDLIGIHLDLLREVERALALTFLLPGAPHGGAYAASLAFARRHLVAAGASIRFARDRAGALLGERLSSLYIEGETPARLPGTSVRFHDVQGVVAEAILAVRHALRAVREGTPPSEVAIVARSLGPYAAALEEVLVGEGLPWTSSLGAPLRRDPAAHDLLLLLRVVVQGFPRRATAELLGSKRLQWGAIAPGERPPFGDRAEVWSRRAGILGGLEEWTKGLEAWAERPPFRRDSAEEDEEEQKLRARERVESARCLGRALLGFERRLQPGRDRSWSEHADAVESLVREVLPGRPDGTMSEATQALLALVDQMRDLAGLAASERVGLGAMLDWLERAVDETEIRMLDAPPAGIHVLDAMQARGATFRRVHLLGFHEGLLPRTPRPDAFLPDAARRRLREETGRPLAVRADAEDEERLLLASMLGSAREELRISWQRADDAGRARTPSLSLREVARACLGSASLAAALDEARSLPAHPQRLLVALAGETGLLSPREELLLLALGAPGSEEGDGALRSRAPGLDGRLAMLRATESFEPADLRWDGRIDPAHVAIATLGVSAFETLGRCPLQFFFRHVLRVRELDDEIDPFDLDAREMGLRVHKVLEAVYRALGAEEQLEPLFRGELHERARALLHREWPEATRDLEARLEPRVPVLWRLRSEQWRSSVERFIAEDLERLVAREAKLRSLEESRQQVLKLGTRAEIEVRARFDRVFATPDGLLVGDYKTGRVEKIDDVSEMLRGRRLQVPLYRMMAGTDAVVEILGVGPKHEPEGDEEPDRPFRSFAGFPRPEQESGFRETLRVLLATGRSGLFPLVAGGHCMICDYSSACRRTHPPTLAREATAPDVQLHRRVQEKDDKHPLLEKPALEGKLR